MNKCNYCGAKAIYHTQTEGGRAGNRLGVGVSLGHSCGRHVGRLVDDAQLTSAYEWRIFSDNVEQYCDIHHI